MEEKDINDKIPPLTYQKLSSVKGYFHNLICKAKIALLFKLFIRFQYIKDR